MQYVTPKNPGISVTNLGLGQAEQTKEDGDQAEQPGLEDRADKQGLVEQTGARGRNLGRAEHHCSPGEQTSSRAERHCSPGEQTSITSRADTNPITQTATIQAAVASYVVAPIQISPGTIFTITTPGYAQGMTEGQAEQQSSLGRVEDRAEQQCSSEEESCPTNLP